MSSHAPKVQASETDEQAPAAQQLRPVRLLSPERRQHRLACASILDDVLRAHSVSTATMAAKMGVSETVARDIRNGLDPLPVERLAMLGPQIELAVLEARCRQLRSQRVPSQVPVVTRALHCSAAAGAVAARVAEAVADGEVDAAEQRDIAKLTCKLKGASELLLDDCAQGGR